jgi:hypothetical protein
MHQQDNDYGVSIDLQRYLTLKTTPFYQASH